MKFLNRLFGFLKPKEEKKEKIKTGFINFFNRSRGYGFIRSKEVSAKIFVHISEIEGRFRVGDRVKFELGRNSKGLIAKNVELTKAS